MTAAQLDRTPMGTQVVFTCGRLKGTTGTVVDVRHEGHHVRVTLADGRTISTRPGAIKGTKTEAPASCPACHGRGLSTPPSYTFQCPCPVCKGTGRIPNA